MAIKIREKYTPQSHSSDLQRLESRLNSQKEGEYRIYVLDSKRPRSLPQNAYYWGVVLKYIADDTGNDPASLHEYLKQRFNAACVIIKSEIAIVPGSTAKMDRKDFTAYVEEVKLWALEELNIRIPEPNEVPDEVYLEMIEKGFIK